LLGLLAEDRVRQGGEKKRLIRLVGAFGNTLFGETRAYFRERS